MIPFLIAFGILLILCLIAALICFLMCFYASRPQTPEGFTLPPGDIYLPYHDVMKQWNDEVTGMPHESIYITSFDGLKLHGKY